MKSKDNKTGRPPKMKTEEKKQLIMNFFLFEAQGNVERMSVHNIYSLLSAYANKNKFDTKPYDFSRDEEVKRIIQSLKLPGNLNSSIIPTYVPLDIKNLMYKAPEEMMKILYDREEYFKNLHMRAATALDELSSLTDQITSLRDTQDELTQKLKSLCSSNEEMREKDIELEKENRYLKAYIKRTIEPCIAESIITGKKPQELSEKASNIFQQTEKEPAVVSISSFTKSDCNIKADISSARSILSKFYMEEE